MTRFLPPQAHLRLGAFVILSAEAARWLVENAAIDRVFAARGRDADRGIASELAALLAAATSADTSATSAIGSKTGTTESASPELISVARAGFELESLPAPLTTKQAASRRGVSDRAIRAACAAGQLPARRHGRGWLIEEHDLDAYDGRTA